MLAGCSSTSSSKGTEVEATNNNVDTTATVAPVVTNEATASLVLRGGLIHSGSATGATAIAVRGDTIVAVGSDADVEKFIGESTRVVDLANRLVIPGLIDSHMHAVSGAASAGLCTLGDAELTVAQMKPIIDKCLANGSGKPDEWLLVVSVNPAALTATAKDIDSLVSDRPALLSGSDGHTAWVNSAGLKAAGITRNTKDPEGGKVERDDKGEPTGKLIDAATGIPASLIPRPTTAENVEALTAAVAQLSAVGITSIRDPAVNDEVMAVYSAMLKTDKLPVRVAGSFALTDMSKSPDELVTEASAFVAKYPTAPDLLHVDQVKVFSDGVIEAPTWTAAMLKPYLDVNGKPTNNLGDLYYDPAMFKKQVAALHKAGMSVHVHAIGDRAVRTALDAFEYSRSIDGNTSVSRDQIVHLQIVDPAEYPRFKKNNVIADFQTEWAFREAYTVEALEPFMGAERYSRVYPVKSLIDAGATVAGGSDWPVSGFSPFVAMQRAVTRRDNKDAQPFVAAEAITIEQALAMYTTGSAATLPFPDLGALKVGAKADVAVLSQNILTVDPDTIGATVSELTVMNGVVVHERK
jgi:predicted amidohydrolase YtcJ